MNPTFYSGGNNSNFEDGVANILPSYPTKLEGRQSQATAATATAPVYYPFSVSTQCLKKQQEDVLEIAKAVCPWLLLVSPADDDLFEEDDDEIKSSSSGSSNSTPTNDADDDEEEEELLRVRPLLGGLSNALYIVEQKQKQQKLQPSANRAAVLVRIHPDSTPNTDNDDENSSIVDRQTETKLVTWLASQPVVPPLAPAVYGGFKNGRVEEFYDNMRPLSSDEMPLYAAAIGQRLAQLHRLTEDVRPLHIFPEKPPATRAMNNNNNDYPLPGGVWQVTDKWYSLVLRTLKQQQEQPHPHVSSTLTAIAAVLKDWEMAWQWTRTAFQQHYNDTSTNTAATRFCRQIVLAHMDCQSLNLLVPLEDDSRNQSNKLTNNHPHGNHDCMRVIDYEYCGLNPRAADIANTFCEICQMNEIKADWELEYPSQETQDELLRAYLRQLEHGGCSDGKEDGSNKDNSSANNFSLSDMRHEVGRYTLVSHLSWTVWALLYAARHLSNYDIHIEEEGCFNYLAYAQQRMDGYRYFRARFWERDSSS